MYHSISIIIPIYNEEANIPELYERLSQVLSGHFKEMQAQMIFVDDGSADDSHELLAALHQKDKRVKVIQLSRNFGHHVAIAAGLDAAETDCVVLMDGDLQDQPEEIPKLFNKLLEGNDLVYSIRENRKDSWFKRTTSGLFWWLINKASGLNIPPNQSMLRIFNKKVLLAVRQFQETHRFYAGIFSYVGFKQTTCAVQHAERTKGETKYSLSKMISLTLTALLGFSNKPLYFISYLGIFISFLSIVYGIYIVVRKVFFDYGVEGWPSMMALIAMMSGIIIFSIGVLGIYLGKTFQQSQNRPYYIINQHLK